MNLRALLLLPALCALLASAVPSGAQSAPPPSDTRVREAALSQLQPGRRILLDLHPGSRVGGRLLRLTSDTLVLQRAGLEQDIPLAAINTVWVPDHRVGTSAAFGGIVGAIGLAALGYTAAQGLCESSSGCGGDSMRVLLGGVVIGGTGGALVGAGIGALVPRWRPLHPR